jgi:hypothetical protein
MRFRTLFVLTMIAGAGCNDAAAPSAAVIAPLPLGGSAVRSYVVQESGSTADRVLLTIHVDSRDVGVAAYQGHLSFDPGSLEITEATTPSDGNRLVNASAGAGLVRFAGFAEERFGSTAAVHLVVKPLKSLDLANIVVSLDVVGQATGIAVSKEKIVATRGLYTAAAAPAIRE